MAVGNAHRKIGKDHAYRSRDILTDGQTDKHTDTHTDKTYLSQYFRTPYEGKMIITHIAHL